MNENELNNNELNAQNNQNEDDRKKRKIKLILIFIIVFVLVFCAVYFGIQLYNSYVTKPLPTTTTAPVSVSQTVEESKVDNPIDFDGLKAQNEDIYAWIKVDDTNVDYPIVQNPTDDEFYLKHSAEDKSWSASGAVYTELINNKNFRDAVTLIYGHNGYGDTMFTTLHRFSDEEFFNTHPYFYIYTQDRRLTYQVVSAFKYDDRHIMNSFNFANLEELEEFQSYVQSPTSSLKNVRTDLDKPINSSSKLVILSTCITNQKSSRYLICGVLTKDEKTN